MTDSNNQNNTLTTTEAKNEGLYKNLVSQVESIYKHVNEKSYASRARYFEATKRFCRFLADNFRLQNFKNVDNRHFTAYVEYLKEHNAAGTIQSDLSGIRFFHRHSGSKNKLAKNKELNLPKRAVGKEDRAWLPEEISKARELAVAMGRQDVVIAIDFISAFGLRLEEMCTLKVEYLMSALKNGQLVVPRGKGGQSRAIQLTDAQRELIKKYLDYAKAAGRYPGDYLISGSEKHGVLKEKRSLQNWVSYHREKFMVANRTELKEEGKKDKHDTISIHGLRHAFAQNRFERAKKETPGKAKKVVSEDLGHHRGGITDTYLPLIKTGAKK